MHLTNTCTCTTCRFTDKYYSTFTYQGSLEIEKLLKIFFFAQIGSSQEAEGGGGSVILIRFASLIRSGNFWRKRDVILAPLFFAPFGRASLRVAREMSFACHS